MQIQSPLYMPVTIKITGDADRQDLLLRSADSSAVTANAAPDLLWKFAVFWDYQFYGKTAIPAVDGGYLIAGESRMNGTEDVCTGCGNRS